MNDREKWRERVRDIRATSTTDDDDDDDGFVQRENSSIFVGLHMKINVYLFPRLS